MARSAYELTRLAFADVVRYRAILDDLRAERPFRGMTYRLAREAVSSYHFSDGDHSILETAIVDLRAHADSAATSEASREPRNNAEVLETYLASFTNPFRPHFNALPPGLAPFSANLFGIDVTGRPHLAVRNAAGKTKFIYLLTAKDWTSDQKGFFISLLGELVCHNDGAACRFDVEGLDCRTGKKVIRKEMGSRNLNRLQFLAEDLIRLGLD